MSENLRMVGIVVFFLLAGSVMWILLSGSEESLESEVAVSAPAIENKDEVMPDFEFDEVVSGQPPVATRGGTAKLPSNLSPMLPRKRSPLTEIKLSAYGAGSHSRETDDRGRGNAPL